MGRPMSQWPTRLHWPRQAPSTSSRSPRHPETDADSNLIRANSRHLTKARSDLLPTNERAISAGAERETVQIVDVEKTFYLPICLVMQRVFASRPWAISGEIPSRQALARR